MKKFTLVELLVVIVIIAILISLLMPSLSSAKKKSVQVSCRNSQSQLSKGMFLFSKDYNAHFPIGYWSYYKGNYFMVGTDNYHISMLGVLYETKILNHFNIYTCPSNKVTKDYEFGVDNKILADYGTRPFLNGESYKWIDFYIWSTNPDKDWKVALKSAPKLTEFEGSETILADRLWPWPNKKNLHQKDGLNNTKIDGSGGWNKYGDWSNAFQGTSSFSDLSDSFMTNFWNSLDDL